MNSPAKNWSIQDILGKIAQPSFTEIAEMMINDFKMFRCPVEVKSGILKTCGIFLKDLVGSTAHLAIAMLPIPLAGREELASYARLPSQSNAVVFTLEKIEEAATIDRAEVRGRLQRLNNLGPMEDRVRAIDLELHQDN